MKRLPEYYNIVQTLVFLVWILLSLSLIAYAKPPIELIYWKASDVKMPSQDELNSLVDVIVEVQDCFASEMDRHKFTRKTFAFNPEITLIKGKLKRDQYNTESSVFVDETPLIERGLDNQIYVVFFGGSETLPWNNTAGYSRGQCFAPPEQWIYCNNFVGIATGISEITLPLVAHELMHAFGIHRHSHETMISDKVDIMSSPVVYIRRVKEELSKYAILREHAAILDQGGRLSVQKVSQDSEKEIVMDTDINDDGYTDLYDCLIVRSGMSIESSYDTDINNDGVTNILDLMLVKAAAFQAIAAAAPSKQKIMTTLWGELKRK